MRPGERAELQRRLLRQMDRVHRVLVKRRLRPHPRPVPLDRL